MNLEGSKNILLGFGAALLSLAVYIPTLAPDITWGDAGELITASYTLSSAHPSGYPLFCLLGKLFSFIPLGSVAYRYNLFCALCSAAAVAGAARLIVDTTGSLIAALAGAMTIAFSRTIWYHAHAAEVYALHLALITWVCWAALRFHQERTDKYLYLAALLGGFGMTNHLTSALFAFPVLFIIFATDFHIINKYRVMIKMTVLFLTPLLIYFYLPLAARYGSGVSWGQPDTWERFWILVTGKQYHFRFGLKNAATNLQMLKNHLLIGFHPAILLTACVGIIGTLRITPIPGAAWILGFLSLAGYTLLYRISDLDSYFAPLDLFIGLWFGIGLHMLRFIVRWIAARGAVYPSARSKTAAAAAVFLIGLAGTGAAAYQVQKNWAFIKTRGISAEHYAQSVFKAAKDRTLVITKGDGYTFALWYQKFVVTGRKDLAVVDVRMMGMDYGQWFLDHLRSLDPDLAVLYSKDIRYNLAYLLDHNYGKFDTVLAVNVADQPVITNGSGDYTLEKRRWYALVHKEKKIYPWLSKPVSRVIDIDRLEMGPEVKSGRLVETRLYFRPQEKIVLFVKWKTRVNHRTDFIWYGPDGEESLRQTQYTPAGWRYSWAWLNERFPKKPGNWRVEVVVNDEVRGSIDFIVQQGQ